MSQLSCWQYKMINQRQINQRFWRNITGVFEFSWFAFFLLLPVLVLALSSGGIGGYPAHPDPNIKYSESWFIYNLDLGESQDDDLILFNTTNEPQTIKLYAVDSVPSNQGNFALEAEAAPKEGIGAWIKLSQTLVTLQPGENQEIPFTITIPPDADVGEHSGGIILQKAQAGEALAASGASIVSRIGIRVYETVPGEIIKAIELTDFNLKLARPANQPPYYDISLTAQNQSNVSLKPQVALVIGGWGKLKYFVHSKFQDGVVIDFRDLTEFFTGTTLANDWQLLRDQEVTTRWQWDKPQFGYFTFQARLTYEANDGLKTLSTPILKVWVIPWLELSVIGAILLLVIGFLVFQRLQYGGRQWQPYVVKQNDRLVILAQQAKISWKALAKVNKLKKPYSLESGQKILLPPGFSTSASKDKSKKSL